MSHWIQELKWLAKAETAEPQAAVAWGEAARRLHNRLCRMTTAQQTGLQATANRDVLIVTGESTSLPWVEGVAYAAPSSVAPVLWLPLHWQPDVPCDLLAQRLIHQRARQPLLLWHQPEAIVPLDRSLPLGPALLTQILAHWQRH